MESHNEVFDLGRHCTCQSIHSPICSSLAAAASLETVI